MTSAALATTWGPPTANKHALLIHGLTSSSHTWHRVASSLVAQGYFVTAPNLIGHGSRGPGDYRLSSIVQDLRPYLEARNYSLIIGHSLGALTALALSPYLPPSHPTAIVLIDPPLQSSEESTLFCNGLFESVVNVKQAEAYSAENPLWEHEDSVFRVLATCLCSVDTLRGVLQQNQPWYFIDLLNMTSSKWKVTALVADPAICAICPIETFEAHPHIRSVVVPGAGHWIQCDFPDVVVEEALKTLSSATPARL